ncbi:hypothetical protein HG530_007458 [Fusarium avenaceum]|nr:hypothetical protein HG530_007458 [Fusarium avenaceum]
MDISPESPLKLEVSLRIPGKLPEVATEAPLGTRAAALGLPELLGGEKKVWEWRGVPSGGETGPSGPRYIWLTRLAAPVYWSLCGRGDRLVLVDLDKPMGILGALSGSRERLVLLLHGLDLSLDATVGIGDGDGLPFSGFRQLISETRASCLAL